MKPTAGSIRPRHVTPPPRKTRLNLQRKPKPPAPEDDLAARQESAFWKWFLIVAVLHVVVIASVAIFYALIPTPKPPEEMMSLIPPGETVKGKPGQQEAHKLGPTTAASLAHHAPAPTPPTPVAPPKPVKPAPAAVVPPTPQPLPPLKPILKTDAPSVVPDKPPVKPPPPKPKVKVDLHLVDNPTAAPDKPKHHLKKPVKNPDDSEESDTNDSMSKTTTTGLSKEEIAAKLGDKTDAAGEKNATKTGASGSDHSKASEFAQFYAMLHDQVMEQWTVPNQMDDAAVNPVVMIHVEHNGHVPPDLVQLVRSSGNAAYDNSALETARSLGFLHEPLPDGCPPDISITFKPNR